LAAIGDVIERHMIEIGFLPRHGRDRAAAAKVVALGAASPGAGPKPLPRPAQCPKCGEAALVRREGCDQCLSCDYSRCG
jgi:ribonucleoside-diphosphate reductase alpha chain